LDLANQKAFKANAVEEAKDYFENAMDLLDALPDSDDTRERRISLLVNQGPLYNLLFMGPEYYELMTRYKSQAVSLGNPGLEGAYYARLGWLEWSLGSIDQSIQTSNRGAQLCQEAGNPADAGYAFWALQWSHLYKGDCRQVLTLKQDILDLMKEQFDLRLYLRTSNVCALAYAYLGEWERAEKEAHESLSVAENYSDNSLIALSSHILSIVCSLRGDVARAADYAKLCFEKAQTPAENIWAQSAMATAWCKSGQPERGVELLESMLKAVRSGRHVGTELGHLGFLCEGYLLAGKYEKATQAAQELLALSKRCGATLQLGMGYRLLAEIALKATSDEALPHFEKAISISQEIKAENELALAYSGMGRYHKQQGNPEQAREYLTKALEIFERLGTLIEPDKVRKELADLSSVR
jgi:tetratricopeptide (TPR) repeat protein